MLTQHRPGHPPALARAAYAHVTAPQVNGGLAGCGGGTGAFVGHSSTRHSSTRHTTGDEGVRYKQPLGTELVGSPKHGLTGRACQPSATVCSTEHQRVPAFVQQPHGWPGAAGRPGAEWECGPELPARPMRHQRQCTYNDTDSRSCATHLGRQTVRPSDSFQCPFGPRLRELITRSLRNPSPAHLP
jgi:hypothetical protein